MTHPSTTHGRIELNVKGSYGLTGIWSEGGAEIERSVLIELAPKYSGGSVDRNAKFSHWAFEVSMSG